MALSSAFKERLEQMELTRNQRLSLLQAEKELQVNNSQILASKLAKIRSMEQRCLMLDQKIASQNFKILTLKTEIENLDAKYQTTAQKLRALKSEVEALEELEKDKDKFYEQKSLEMHEFRRTVVVFESEHRIQVEKLRNRVNELKSSFEALQANNGYTNDNSEVAAAEIRKAELVATKENLAKHLVSNRRIRAALHRQLHGISNIRNQGR